VLGAAGARAIFRRWAREDAEPLRDEPLATRWRRQAAARPRWYDWAVTVGRGPHSPGLIAALGHRAAAADVVIAGFTPFATVWHAGRAARTASRPLLVLPFFHPEDRYHHFEVFYRGLAAADAVLAQTAYSADLFARLAGARPLTTGVGVDLAELDDARIDGAAFRRRHGLDDQRLVLFVGRKEPSKRYAVAIAAVEALADPRVTLLMVGADIDRRPIDSPRVRYLGSVERAELLDAYDACDAFILPSAHESFGIVFLEAWMRGKPVLGNRDCLPVASVIADGVDGYLCGDDAEYAARLRQLLDTPATAAALGAAGRAKTIATYGWDAIANRVLAHCAELVAARPRGRTDR
jgi:glycosyltransferase involved in cell wall biosynthesis